MPKSTSRNRTGDWWPEPVREPPAMFGGDCFCCRCSSDGDGNGSGGGGGAGGVVKVVIAMSSSSWKRDMLVTRLCAGDKVVIGECGAIDATGKAAG